MAFMIEVEEQLGFRSRRAAGDGVQIGHRAERADPSGAARSDDGCDAAGAAQTNEIGMGAFGSAGADRAAPKASRFSRGAGESSRGAWAKAGAATRSAAANRSLVWCMQG